MDDPADSPLPGPGVHTRSELLAAGVPRRQLGGVLWTRTNRGVYRWSGRVLSERERIRAAATVLPERAAIGGWAAAVLLGVPGLDGRRADGTPRPVPVCVPRHGRCRRTEGLVVLRSDLADDEIVEVDGMPVTSLVRTAADLARTAGGWREGVVLLDRVAAVHPPALGQVEEWLRRHPRRAGVSLARSALAFARPGTQSAQETRLRLLWVVDAGLPQPLVNPFLEDVDGTFLARTDLFDPEAALAGEYDGGEYHSSAEQRSSDHRRRERVERRGVIVVQFTSVDLGRHRREAVARLRARFRAGLARDRSGDRWRLRAT